MCLKDYVEQELRAGVPVPMLYLHLIARLNPESEEEVKEVANAIVNAEFKLRMENNKEDNEVDNMANRLGKAIEINNMYGVKEVKRECREFEVRSETGHDYIVSVFPNGAMECETLEGEPCPDRAPYCKHKLSVMEAMNEKRV
jgi:hypothetical protein